MAAASDRFDFEWVRLLGAERVEVADGRCVMRLHPRGVHLNHNGTVNAPMLFGLAEVAGAGAVTVGMMDLLSTAYVAVKHAEIDYVAPARQTVTAVGVVDAAIFAAAKADVAAGVPVDLAAAVEVTDSTGRVVARVNLTMAVRPSRGAPTE